MDEVVEVLIQKETIEREEFLALMEGAKLEEPHTPPSSGLPVETPPASVQPRVRPEPRLQAEPGPA
jgi:hypothetical protein